MANYLINSPSSETFGTDAADLFSIQELQGVTVFGIDGADTISSDAGAASAGLLNAGKGADTINLSGGAVYDNSRVFAGAGHDSISITRDLSSTVVRGGQGFDSISFVSGSFNRSTINGNDLADVISGDDINDGSNRFFVGGGKGGDTIALAFENDASGFTVNGGAGHDLITVSASAAGGSLNNFTVAGGDGFDTITFSVTGTEAIDDTDFNINGDSLADRITFEGALQNDGGGTVGGGEGADTIRFLDTLGLSGGFVNAGAGLDSIYISGAFQNDTTVNGGAGADTITLGTFGATGSDFGDGVLFGDAQADKFDLGTVSYATGDGSGTEIGGSTLGYASFDQSNLSAFDFVSASITFSETIASGAPVAANFFTITQDVVSGSVATNVGNPTTFTGTDGIAAFTSTFAADLTSRVTELDRVLTEGQVIAFTANTNQNFIFVQGGAASGGSSDDLLIRTNQAAEAFSIAGGTAISVRVNNA